MMKRHGLHKLTRINKARRKRTAAVRSAARFWSARTRPRFGFDATCRVEESGDVSPHSKTLVLLALLLLCLASSVFAAAPTNAPTYIVLLDHDVNVDTAVQWVGAKPSFVYHGKVHGFAAKLDPHLAAQLQHLSGFSVETNPAPVIVTVPASGDPKAVVKAMGLHPRFVYGAWPKPAWFKGNQFKGFAVTLDAPGLAKLDGDSRIADVEPDGHVTVCGQANGLGYSPAAATNSLFFYTNQFLPDNILRMGLMNFPMVKLDGRDERIDVDVAVLDTGIQIDTTNLATNSLFLTTIHGPNPDLPPVVHAEDFADPGYYGDDWDGHGTMMAGTIGALDNHMGIVGVAPGVRLWSVQVLGPTESAWANVLAGLDYIAQNADQIEVVNASITDSSGNTPYSAAEQAVASIVNQGTVFVAAAGNSGMDVCGNDFVCGTSDDVMPAALPEVLCVSGADSGYQDFGWPGYAPLLGLDLFNGITWAVTNYRSSDQIAIYVTNFDDFQPVDLTWDGSNYSYAPRTKNFVSSPGLNIDVAAPATVTLSLSLSQDFGGAWYETSDGTSDSTAAVTGLVALYIAANGRPTNAAGVYHLRQTLIDDGQPQSQWRPWGQPYDVNTNNTGDPDGNLEPLAIASEAWVPKPEFYSERRTTNGFTLNFGIVPGYQYTVQYSDSLAGTNHWQDLTVTNGTGKLTPVTVTYPAPAEQRFYRLKRTPTP